MTELAPSGSVLVYSTYLGGAASDAGNSIAVYGLGDAYVTGWTGGSGFPITPGAYDPGHNGGFDVFVTVLWAGGSTLKYSTYLGGSASDEGCDIAVDYAECAHVTGYTWSTGFPLEAAYFPFGGACDAFVTKFSSSGNPLTFSTYLGGSNLDYGEGIAVDASGCAVVTGRTYSADFPVLGIPPFPSLSGGYDAFVTRLGPLPCSCISWCDLTGDGAINPIDVVSIANYVYKSIDGREQYEGCPAAGTPNYNGDWDCDGLINPTDVVLYVNYVYKGLQGPCDPCACSPYPTNCPLWP